MKWTMWERLDKGKYTYNHSEAGWVDGNSPRPKDPSFIAQAKNWANAEGWRKRLTHKIGIRLVII